MGRRKLLLVAPTCDGADVGEAWVAFQWASRLAERAEVTLLTYHKRNARPAAEQLPGLRVIEWPEMALFTRAERLNSMLKPSYVPFYFRARRWIKTALARGEQFDVAHQPTPVAMRYPSPAAGLGIPLVIGPVGGALASPPGFAEEEGSNPWFMRLRGMDRYRLQFDPLLRASYESADCVLGIAPYVGETLAELSLKRLEFMSETALEQVPEPIVRTDRGSTVKLLFVGRLVRTKGVRDIVRAMQLLSDVAVTLDVVGTGPEQPICEALAGEMGVSSRITFHGWQARAELDAFYRNADLFVFPSYREPGGNVALEAMSYSLPLIVVDRGGPGNAVSPQCAIRLQASTPENLAREVAAAIRQLAGDPEQRARMGQAAYHHVKATGLWSARIARIEAIYDELEAGQLSVRLAGSS
ncbi:glycosyltransferase family 4 protein [Devosia sp. 1566]|uniref:glycosyltransferase family 4 protein n=1 Tax=Devosia sp. 1566 TaxID=2499144 RepID=UPI000FDC4079|nr:glycosyltransferase family 4 protein [Devosia sp. 1566]